MGTLRLSGGRLFTLFSLFLAVSFCSPIAAQVPSDRFLAVVGAGECTDCAEKNIKNELAFKGLTVSIKCKTSNGEYEIKGASELDKDGNFNVQLSADLVNDDGALKHECSAHLLGAKNTPCPEQDGLHPSKIELNSNKDGARTFVIAAGKKVPFSSETCISAFFWPYYKHPPLPKWEHPFHKYLPWYKPPTPVYKPLTPVYKPPTPVYKPPTPVYKPPTPVYKPPTPVYKPPTPVYKPPTPVYKPPTPVYKPPTPVYKPPCNPPTPVYKPPSPVYKPPYKPPTSVYKPPTPVYKPPYKPPTPVYKPPVYKKPCPPLPQFPPIHKPPFPQFPPIYKKPLPPFPFPPIYKKPIPPFPQFPPIYKKPLPPFPFPPVYKKPWPPLPPLSHWHKNFTPKYPVSPPAKVNPQP